MGNRGLDTSIIARSVFNPLPERGRNGISVPGIVDMDEKVPDREPVARWFQRADDCNCLWEQSLSELPRSVNLLARVTWATDTGELQVLASMDIDSASRR